METRGAPEPLWDLVGDHVPESLWDLLVDHVPESELPEVRGVLGDALVDMNTDLHAEVDTWRQIWRAVRSGKLGGSIRPQTPRLSLDDPPAIRELLRAEVRLLLCSVRDHAVMEGGDRDAAMLRYKPAVVNYALGAPSNAWDGVEVESSLSLHGDRSSSRQSISSSSQEEVEAMRNHLNISSIDQVVAHLRSILTEECEQLKRQVQILQESVEQEHRAVGATPEPTLTELRKERRVIRMDLEGLSPRDHGPPSCSSWAGSRAVSACDRLSPLASTPTPGPHPPLRARPGPQRTPPSASLRAPQSPLPPAERRIDLAAELTHRPAVPNPLRSPRGTSSPGASQPCSSPTLRDLSPLLPRQRPGTASGGVAAARDSPAVRELSGHHRTSSGNREATRSPASSPLLIPDHLYVRHPSPLQSPAYPRSHCGSRKAARPGGLPPLLPSGCVVAPPGRVPSVSATFLPAPPAVQRPASRGRRVARRLCVPQGDSLVGLT